MHPSFRRHPNLKLSILLRKGVLALAIVWGAMFHQIFKPVGECLATYLADETYSILASFLFWSVCTRSRRPGVPWKVKRTIMRLVRLAALHLVQMQYQSIQKFRAASWQRLAIPANKVYLNWKWNQGRPRVSRCSDSGSTTPEWCNAHSPILPFHSNV